MHNDIQRFTREVIIRDNKDFARLKEVQIQDLEDEMRDHGVLRCIDIDPHWSTEFILEKNYFVCTLSLYGVFVGEDDCPRDQAFYHGKQIKVR
jgi:hypothetical protein